MEREEKKSGDVAAKFNLQFVSKKRKRRDFGVDDLSAKKRKLNAGEVIKVSEAEVSITFSYSMQMKVMNSKLIEEQEKTFQEFIDKNKAFFEQFSKEETSAKIKKDVKLKTFGNKDKSFKKQLADKWMDPRLQQLEKVWLKGMKVLDIGCGSGVVDILLGVRYEPKLVIGVDIDHQMIKSSIDNMQKVINEIGRAHV